MSEPDFTPHQHKLFEFIRACGELLGLSDKETGALLDDPCWFFCFDDGLSPEQAVASYRKRDTK